MATEDIYIFVGAIIVGAILAKIADEYKLPYPLPLIAVGVILRVLLPDLLGDIGFDLVAALALAAVLFYAGLTMNIKELRLSSWTVVLLASAGVLLTSVIAGLTIGFFAGIGLTAYLIGAILSPTDPAALFSVLESGGVRVKRKLFSVLEGEAVFNDATAVILVIVVFQPLIIPVLSQEWYFIVGEFIASIGLGIIIGLIVALSIGTILHKTGEETNIAILTAATPLMAYGFGELFGGFQIHPGALAAVFAGIFLANPRRIGLEILPQKSMRGAMKQVSFLFEIVVFTLLGYSVDFVAILADTGLIITGLIVAVLIIFVARPVSVYLVTAFDRTMDFKDRFFVSWAGVKGVASAALAALAIAAITNPANGVDNATNLAYTINSIVFIVLVASLTIQGLTTRFFAIRLNLLEEHDTALDITAQRNATRYALLHLVDEYTEGKIETPLYQKLKAELEEEIFRLEDELKKIIAEKRARIAELEAREMIFQQKLQFYESEFEKGRLTDSIYEDCRRELEADIDEIMTMKRRQEES